MTPKQARFVTEYCVDENATQAAIRAGYSPDTAGQMGYENLNKPEIAAAIEARKADCVVAAGITPEWVAAQWVKLANADPGELTQVRRVNCRHCHGYSHAYQWTADEYRQAAERAVNAGQAAPDGIGGFGFLPNADPHPDCPECGGEGIETVFVADTRKLRGDAKKLFAGVQKTKDGIKVLMRDQDAALGNLARYLGMMVDRKELSGPGGGPLALASIRAEDLTDAQLAAIVGNADAD